MAGNTKGFLVKPPKPPAEMTAEELDDWLEALTDDVMEAVESAGSTDNE